MSFWFLASGAVAPVDPVEADDSVAPVDPVETDDAVASVDPVEPVTPVDNLENNEDQEIPTSQPPNGCTCIVSEDAKSCNEHEATCKDWDNTGMDWCYVSSDEESCGTEEKTIGNCGVPFVKCSGK